MKMVAHPETAINGNEEQSIVNCTIQQSKRPPAEPTTQNVRTTIT
jgi:hypothetical protein